MAESNPSNHQKSPTKIFIPQDPTLLTEKNYFQARTGKIIQQLDFSPVKGKKVGVFKGVFAFVSAGLYLPLDSIRKVATLLFLNSVFSLCHTLLLYTTVIFFILYNVLIFLETR